MWLDTHHVVFTYSLYPNPFKPNEISKPYELNTSISVTSLFDGIFQFYLNFNRTFCKQTVKTDQKPYPAASDIGLHC